MSPQQACHTGRRLTCYVLWTSDHPRDIDWADPQAYCAVFAPSLDIARIAMTDLVGPDGWEIQHDVPSPASLFPRGCLALVWVSPESADLFVRDETTGRLVPASKDAEVGAR